MPSIYYWCQDESRFGLKTIIRRRLTLRGVKPQSSVQWSFKSYYLYGMVEPLIGESLFLEFSHLNTDCFQAYLQAFSQTYPISCILYKWIMRLVILLNGWWCQRILFLGFNPHIYRIVIQLKGFGLGLKDNWLGICLRILISLKLRLL
jgi:hypothetical protein